MKQQITKVIEFDYGHVLPDYFGFCNQLHGHRGKVEATFEGTVFDYSPMRGMVIDFSSIKTWLKEVIVDKIDHAFAVWENDVKPVRISHQREGHSVVRQVTTLDFIKARNDRVLITKEPPTAETLVRHFFEELYKFTLEANHTDNPIELVKLVWYETPSCFATYTKEDHIKNAKE